MIIGTRQQLCKLQAMTIREGSLGIRPSSKARLLSQPQPAYVVFQFTVFQHLEPFNLTTICFFLLLCGLID